MTEYKNKETGENVKVKNILGVYNGIYIYTAEGRKTMSVFGLKKFYEKYKEELEIEEK